MLSTFVLLPTGDGPPALGPLVRTLGTLVPATVEGLVRDVTVIARAPDDGVRRVTDYAGCHLVENGLFGDALAEAMAGARAATIFLLRAGAFLDRSFLDEAGRRFGPHGSDAQTRPLLIREVPENFLARVLPALAPVAGLIASRAVLSPPPKDFEDLLRRQRAAQTLQSRAAMAR